MHVLSLCQAEIRSCPASPRGQDEEAVVLDKGTCYRVEEILYKEYLLEPDTKTRIPEVWQRAVRFGERAPLQGTASRSSAKECYERNMRSYWKTTVFNRYGGEIWLFVLIAKGRVHSVSVQIVDDIFAERIREGAKREPTSDPPAGPATARCPCLVAGPSQRRAAPEDCRQPA